MRPLELTIAATIAVFLGSVGSHYATLYIDAQLARYALQQVAAAQHQTAERAVAAARRARINTATGRDLARRCGEFRSVYQQNGGSYAREQRDEACVRYDRYIDTGRTR